MYELEKHRVADYATGGGDTYTIIAKSPNRDELLKLAESVRLKVGRTFYEKLTINELDKDGGIIDVETILYPIHEILRQGME